MKAPQAPRLEKRRAKEFAAELKERAGVWMPGLALEEGGGDFASALVEIAARFNSEVAERLDGAGEKMRRGFLDWLAVRGQAARPARMPVVFKLADTATGGVLADSPVRLQADADGTPVVFETEADVRIVPGTLEVVVGVDADEDAFFLPPPGLSDLEPLEPLPTEWQVRSFAAAGATRFQLDPEAGLLPDTVIQAGGEQYRIVKADDDLVTIDRPLINGLEERAVVTKVVKFSPFDDRAYNQQQHALYLGDSELLNVGAPATIEVIGASQLRDGFVWEYWGKVDGDDEAKWRRLAIESDKQVAGSASVVLTKSKGEIVDREIGGKKGKWIRAFAKTVEPTASPIHVEAFTLRINSTACDKKVQCPPTSPTESPEAEAMANSTPLVVDSVFFPFGKEPRQFDAFYLGSKEAFSKKGARVQICFEMADPTFSALSAVREGKFANLVLAGVAQDRALHLLALNPSTGVLSKFLQRDPLQPPMPGFQGQGQAGNPAFLDEKPSWRLPVWFEASPASFVVGVTSGNAIWLWREDTDRDQSGWVGFGELPLDTQTPARLIDGLVYLADAFPTIAALRGEVLFLRSWPSGQAWTKTNTLAGGNPVNLKSIVPVLIKNAAGELVTSRSAGMVGVDSSKKLFHVADNGTCTPLLPATNFNPGVRPVAVKIANDLIVVGVDDSTPPKLVAHHDTQPSKVQPVSDAILGSLEAVVTTNNKFHVIASVGGASSGRLATWAPFEPGAAGNLLYSEVSSSGGKNGGAPTVSNGYVIVPGEQADLLISKFDLSRRLTLTSNVGVGIVVPDSVPPLATNDLIVLEVTNAPEPRFITQAGRTKDGEVFYAINSPFTAGATPPLFAFKLSDTQAGTFTGPDQLKLDPGDRETKKDDWLLIENHFFNVDAIDRMVDPWVATISSPIGGPMPTTGTYVRPIVTGGRVASFMHLNPSPNQNGDWNADLLDRIPLIFPGKTPREQRGKAFSLALGNRPVIVVLEAEFQDPINVVFDFVLDAAIGEWQRQLADTSSNPELSWEYSTGTAWESLVLEQDATLNFKKTGIVRFRVPDDLVPVDWSGKTNHWIRARLIGGDYGKETVIVRPVTLPGRVIGQTVDRSTEGIRPPSVLRLSISYGFCDGVLPAFVLAEDSGTVRDQSDANRTSGAIVEAFVPLATTLGRLSKSATPVDDTAAECSPECVCDKHPSSTTGEPANAAPAMSTTLQRDSGRSIFLGLNATPSDGPVNVLVLVDEKKHTSFAPMAVEALVADRLVQIVVDDKSRALGETGLLSMAFAVPPTRSELFGRENLTWLRLKPKANTESEWLPTFRGAYLNAVWASATETLTRELLGSSNGEPHLTVRLARPPVLYNTLELRVKEPLGEEDREALLKIDKNSVLSNVENLPGDWVLWNEVVDPDDEPASARVFSLDENTGEIRFGDGRHGRIPPIGRDAIVAFRYSRTEPDPTGGDKVPGNLITARTKLNLVSPVETVENVTSAEQAAGGAPPESDERVLRFGFARLRHRDRAVTAYDIEDLALQSSPDIVQAHAFERRGYLDLIVVMRGMNPIPNASQIRELRRLLLSAAPVSLSAPGALRIGGPVLRRLRVDLELRVARLDFAGDLTDFVKTGFAGFFNSATGGTDRQGWSLGLNPNEGDIALALLDAPQLDSIKSVKLWEVTDDERLLPWPANLMATELVMLADDPVRIQFETGEVTV